ncbi:MAG: hypothetical protein WCC92_22070 [Candidatus Korobacteraceae bacterium]
MVTEAAKPQPGQEKKKRHRSPNYPAVGLKEAIDRLKKFVSTDGKAGATPDMAAKHIGFASAHGWAHSVLSALKKFGLVEDSDGRVVPTQRALEIISLPEKDERRLVAIRQAAGLPPVYAQLIEQYKGIGLPSDETLEGELKAYKGFNPNTVKDFLRDFKETLEFAGLSDFSVLGSDAKAGNDVEGSPTGALAEVGTEEAPAEASNPLIAAPTIMGAVRGGGSATVRQDVFSLVEGTVTIQWPTPLSMESIQDLKDWLKIVERKISRSTIPETQESWKDKADQYLADHDK